MSNALQNLHDLEPSLDEFRAAVLAGQARFDFRLWRWVNLIRWAERFDVNFD